MTQRSGAPAVVLALICLLHGSPACYAQLREIREAIRIDLDGAPFLGQPDAIVTMVEFSDYQCPVSSQHYNWTVRRMADEYIKTARLKYVFRDFPIQSIHPLSVKAAEAAYCAGEQGKYWQMHDRFFANQGSIELTIFPLHATALRLDVPKFQQCLDSGKYTSKVRAGVADGQKVGVDATPTIFLGLTDRNEPGLQPVTSIVGGQPYAVVKDAVDRLLSTAAEKRRHIQK